MSSFLAAILASHDQTSLVTSALQLVELLLVKLPDSYQYFFRREGVMHEIERLASQPIISLAKSKKISSSLRASGSGLPASHVDPIASTSTPTSAAPTLPSGIARALVNNEASSGSRSSSVASSITPSAPATVPANSTVATTNPIDALAMDSMTRRAQHILAQYASTDSEPDTKARDALDSIRSVVARLEEISSGKVNPKQAEGEKEVVALMAEVAALFADAKSPLSSFELLESGLVGGLLHFTTDSGVDRCEFCLPSASLIMSPSSSFSLRF